MEKQNDKQKEKRNVMIRDSIILGAVAGTIGGVVMLAINLFLFTVGIIPLSQLHQAARAVVPAEAALGTAPVLALGLAVNLFLFIGLGILAVFILNATGRDQAAVKGLLFGLTVWAVIYGLLAPLFIPVQILRPDLLTSASLLAVLLIFGLITFLVVAQSRPVERV